jgi:hypothetical protein
MAELPGYPFNLSNDDKLRVINFIRDIHQVCEKHNLGLIYWSYSDNPVIGSYFDKDDLRDETEFFNGVLRMVNDG